MPEQNKRKVNIKKYLTFRNVILGGVIVIILYIIISALISITTPSLDNDNTLNSIANQIKNNSFNYNELIDLINSYEDINKFQDEMAERGISRDLTEPTGAILKKLRTQDEIERGLEPGSTENEIFQDDYTPIEPGPNPNDSESENF